MKKRAKILLIDDSEVLAESLADTLRMEGYDVVTESNAVKAMSSLHTILPDLIITDLMMPEVDGIQFITTLRSKATYKTLPVIAYSADPRFENKQVAGKAGANLFLAKPFDEKYFIRAIARLIKKQYLWRK